jgi:hypothetical protein
MVKTIAIYTFFDDILKSMSYKEPQNRKVSDPEVSTVILIAAMYFRGNIETAYTDYDLENRLADNSIRLWTDRKTIPEIHIILVRNS